jgi:hypothetical protein
MPRSNAVLDNFNRASIGTNWSGQPLNDSAQTLTIQSSVAVGGSGYDYAWWNVTQFSDQTDSGAEIAIAISTLPANDGALWAAFFKEPSAASTTADGYELATTIRSGADDISAVRYLNGAATTILATTTLASDWAAADLFIIRRSTTGVMQFIRDRGGTETVLHTLAADTTYTGSFFTSLGYFDGAGTIRLDDYSAGNYTVVSTDTRPILNMAAPVAA